MLQRLSVLTSARFFVVLGGCGRHPTTSIKPKKQSVFSFWEPSQMKDCWALALSLEGLARTWRRTCGLLAASVVGNEIVRNPIQTSTEPPGILKCRDSNNYTPICNC